MPKNQFIDLGTEQDKAGNTLTIHQSLELGMSPAYSLFLRHYAETIDNGYAYPNTLWNDVTCGIIYAKHNKDIVGQITYDTKPATAPGALWIILSSIREDYRGNGIYKILHKYIDAFAKNSGFVGIASHVHVKNEAQLRALESVGKKPIFYMVGKKIKD